MCRSREGAWIEISEQSWGGDSGGSRSREGAWIEIDIKVTACSCLRVAPVRERGLKCLAPRYSINPPRVAPVRERGLKCRRCGAGV